MIYPIFRFYIIFLERKESEILIRTYLKTALTLSAIFRKSTQFQSILSLYKHTFVRILMCYQKAIKISFILRVLNLSPSIFYHWKNQILYPCKASAIRLCHLPRPES